MAGFTESGFDCKLCSSRNVLGLRRDSFIFACAVKLPLFSEESADILASFMGSFIFVDRAAERDEVVVFFVATAFLAFEVARFPASIFFFDFAELAAFVDEADLDFVFFADFAAVGFLAVLVAIMDSF